MGHNTDMILLVMKKRRNAKFTINIIADECNTNYVNAQDGANKLFTWGLVRREIGANGKVTYSLKKREMRTAHEIRP